ncbi:hypothetical protein JCM10207_008886 [Rhodosporidiobolus poonsookiae]
MAKSTPRSASKAAPNSKSTPASSTKKASASPAAPASSSKKRVRVVENDDAEESVRSPAPSSAKKSKGTKAAAASAAAESTSTPSKLPKGAAGKKGQNGVVLQDLRDKAVDEIEVIRSKDAPEPKKGALKKGKGKAAAAQEPEQEQEEEDEIALEEAADEEDSGDEAFLEGFEDEGSDEGADSSDEEMDEEDAKKRKAATEKLVGQLPKVKGGSVEKKLKEKEGKTEDGAAAKKEKKQPKTGTVYLGRIPKGFYEEEMRSYFSQFGEVTRLRLSRNKQTGASKHYAFIEFKYASVASIVHETMDNYLLAGHILVCKVIPDDQIHPKLWVGANRRFRVVPKARKEAKRREAPKTDAQKATLSKRLLSREEKKRAQLAELGIEYDFAGFAGKEVEGAEKEPVKEEKATPAKGKKGRKSAGGEEPAKKKPRKSK